jgi:anhydro-N-acetylmuramic acid kinase
MHGQTIHHTPPPDGVTWQLGWPSWVAARTRIPTAGDFRVADAALGGQAAPLAPLAHGAFFGDPAERRVVLNIGGIANITVLEPGGAAVAAFDTGPGNMVVDGVVQDASGGRILFDDGGRIARSGHVAPRLLDALLADDYFHRAAPKSTGRERFGQAFRTPLRSLNMEDAAATAVALTVETVRTAILEAHPDRVIVAGGGTRNTWLMEQLDAALPVPVEDSSRYGILPEAVEAAVFAWLGDACRRRVRHALGPITGGKPTRLGVMAWPP